MACVSTVIHWNHKNTILTICEIDQELQSKFMTGKTTNELKIQINGLDWKFIFVLGLENNNYKLVLILCQLFEEKFHLYCKSRWCFLRMVDKFFMREISSLITICILYSQTSISYIPLRGYSRVEKIYKIFFFIFSKHNFSRKYL